MKTLLLTGLAIPSYYYKKIEKLCDIDYFEWWKEKDISLETIFRTVKKYDKIITHSAGSTLLYFTFLNYNYFHNKKISVISFDGHLITGEKTITKININKVIRNTLGPLKNFKQTNQILNHIKNFHSKNKILEQWALFLLNINKFKVNKKLNSIRWFETHFTQVCQNKLYVPYKDHKYNCDLFCKAIVKTFQQQNVFLVLNETHFTICYKTNSFIGLISDVLFKESLLYEINVPNTFKRSFELGTSGVVEDNSSFFVKKLPFNKHKNYHEAKIIVLDKTINWKHNWVIKATVIKGSGLEINSTNSTIRIVDTGDVLHIFKNEPHFFIRGYNVLFLDVKAYLEDVKRKSHDHLPYPLLLQN